MAGVREVGRQERIVEDHGERDEGGQIMQIIA